MNKYDKALLSGTVLRGKKNSYRIDRVLGQGTFGITYLAYTTVTVEGDLGKLQGEMQVAIKEFFMSDINGREGSSVTTGGSGELFDRYRHKFAREASNLAKLKHRGIVKVIETFEANGTSYYAMEYCGGGSLDALIANRGGLPEGDALRYFGQIAEALSYMHSQRMLHLDLKPGNVMLRTDGEAVLIDFGLSKQFNDKDEPESSTTIGGGTPGYAPLEQANYREDSGKLPVTMDIYALGGTLYKMLTGKRPPVASDVLIEFPEQPLRDYKVSNNVITAIRRAMESKPHDRYQSSRFCRCARLCQEDDKHTTLNVTGDTQEIIAIIAKHLAAGCPIVAGVNHTLNYGINNGTTDHFIVINGINYDEEGRLYFNYIETGRKKENAASACDDSWRLYYYSDTTTYTGKDGKKHTILPGMIFGDCYNKERYYTISEIRPYLK